MWILLPCVLADLCWSACLVREGWENMEWDDLWDDETDFSFTCLTSLTAGASGWWKLISLREVEFFPHFCLIPILVTISVSLLMDVILQLHFSLLLWICCKLGLTSLPRRTHSGIQKHFLPGTLRGSWLTLCSRTMMQTLHLSLVRVDKLKVPQF